jgi:hypothetical protein
MECGDGWFELIDATCRLIQQHEKAATAEPCVAYEIKEKFGTLRLYCGGTDTYLDSVIDLSERLSGSICEVCGETGKTYEQNSWLKTRCSRHATEPTNALKATLVGLPPTHSPLAGVLAAALQLFEQEAAATALWLTSTSSALSGSPLAEAVNQRNYQQVMMLIERTEPGMAQ